MSVRMFARLPACKYIWMWREQTFLRMNTVRVVQKSYGFTSQNSKHIRVQGESRYGRKDLYRKLPEKEESLVAKEKVMPIGEIYPSKKFTKSAQIFEAFAVTSLNEDGFNKAIEEFQKRDLRRLKLIEFISTAVAYMDLFGVSKNLDVYNKLLDVFPKGRYHYRNVFDTLWTRYRPQIDSAIHVLTKMEENGLRPNVDTYDILEATFREDSIPMNKLRRIVFWFDQFDIMYPDPLPKELPTDKPELFKLAIKRMFGDTAPTVEYKNSADNPLIVGTQSADILQQLEDYDDKRPMFVEGPFYVWLRKIQMFYYVLQVDITPDVEDPIVAACFIDGSAGEEELKRWLRELQKDIPRLAKFNVIFNISNNETTQ